MPLHVAFLWHMHQPYYVDPIRGTALMPWVRLHATKGYLDMIWQVEQHPEFRCTFNLTPVLLKQIEQLAAGQIRDLWHELAATPAEALTPEQKADLLEHFFKANWQNMVRPYPRYWALLQKRGTRTPLEGWARMTASFGAQEYRDLQTWFNLAWFGYAGERLYSEIADLKKKGRDFSELDKQTVFEAQTDILKNIVSYYRAVAERGQIEISTTPFYHPILPLVYDTGFARRCQPDGALPARYTHPEDVRAQLAMARDYHARLFGKPPVGLWPSEGSVCPELIPVLQGLGFQWFATDEDVLWQSLAGKYDPRLLQEGHRVRFGEGETCAAFRVRQLSDFIGFSAARNDPRSAAAFLMNQLEEIAGNATGENPLCAIVLDGENAWEQFDDGGNRFLAEIYARLGQHGKIQSTTFSDYFRENPPQHMLQNLHTGSWIQANFRIWIGHPEDNRGWDLLGQTRRFLEAKQTRGELTEEQYRLAMDEVYAAEGSDWFWWYGDDFVTENDLIFDELFRSHLQNVYNICRTAVPDALKLRICRSEVGRETQEPTDLISPVIDGRITTFYEWVGAGVYAAGGSMGAMFRANQFVERIHFGADSKRFYLRVDFKREAVVTGELEFQLSSPDGGKILRLIGGDRPFGKVQSAAPAEACYGQVVEVGVPIESLSVTPGGRFEFVLTLIRDGVEVERHPEAGALGFTLPDDLFTARNWSV